MSGRRRARNTAESKTGPTKFGFVGLAGTPNAGKSSLANRLVGQKVSIVSGLPQTTRHRIRAIMTEGNCQAALVDMPGILRTEDKFNQTLVDCAVESLRDCDLILHVRDPKSLDTEDERRVVEILRHSARPVLEVRNKIDLKTEISPRKVVAGPPMDYAGRHRVSARTGGGIEALKRAIMEFLPEGPWHYPADDVSDRDLRFLCAELVREKTFEFLHQELPYGIATWTEEWEENPKRPTRMRIVIQTEREAHKRIIIGAGGEMLKKIGTAARREIELLCGSPVFLELWVRVRERWRKDSGELDRLGLRQRSD